MKRFYIGGLLFLLFLFSVYPQQGAASTGTADIIVLLDNSGTMFPFFDTINNAVLEDITAHFIRRGDTFHLITFNTTPVTEIVQQISSEMDIRRIISRFRLLYPLGVYSDFLSAIKFTQRYVNSLTTDSQKIVVIISDGILNPPSASPYYQVSPEEAEGEIISSVSRMHRDGIQIYFIKAPFPEGVKIRNLGKSTEEEVPQPEISSGTEIPAAEEPVTETKTEPPGPEPVQDGEDTEPDFFEYATTLDQIPSVVTDTLPETGEAPSFTETTLLLPEITFREALGRQFYTFRLPLRITNNADRRLRLQLDRIIINSENVLEKTLFIDVPPRGTSSFKPTVILPDSWEPGEHMLSAQLVFADNVRVQPQWFRFSVTLKPGMSFAEWFRQYRFIFFAVLMIAGAVILIIVIVVLLNRILSGSHANAIRLVQEAEKAGAVKSGSGGQALSPLSRGEAELFRKRETVSAAPETSVGKSGEALSSRETADRSAAAPLQSAAATGSAETAPVSARAAAEKPASSLSAKYGAGGTAEYNASQRHSGEILPQKETTAERKSLFARGAAEEPGTEKQSLFGKKAQDKPAADTGTDSFRRLDTFGRDRAASGNVLDSVKTGNTAGKESARTLDAFRRDRAASGNVLDSVKTGRNDGWNPAGSLDSFRPDRSASEGVLNSVKNSGDSSDTSSALLLAGAGRPDSGEWKLPAIHKQGPQKKDTNRRPAVSPGKVGIRGQSSIMLELFVDRQNRNIGKRNIHMLKPGSRMTVGGTNRSAFMVFLVKFPASLAEIRYDGVSCSLAILKPEYFPEETDTVIEDCLNRDIILRSDKGYEVTFRLKKYENPAIQLNRLLLSLNE